jgi:hypothetical protein
MFGNKPTTTPKDFFLYIAMAAALYVSAVALIGLWFNYINYLFPDALRYYDLTGAEARGWIATLIVAFPLFFIFARMANQAIRKESDKANLWIRKWLLYLTLFVAGGTMAVDLIILLKSFLGGELSSHFFLKILVVFIVAAAVFFYFIKDIRGYWEKREKQSLAYGGVASLVVLVSIVFGFVFYGSPMTQRALRFDNQRVSDLQSIQWQVVDYWQNKEELPANLSDLEDELLGYVAPTDPETEDSYEYSRLGDLTFELCANFSMPNNERTPSYAYPIREHGPGLEEGNWQHEAGRECFERTIDPDIYQPRSVAPRGITN